MGEKISPRILDKLFENINIAYNNYLKSPTESKRYVLLTSVWNMLERSKYKKRLENDSGDLPIEITKGLSDCIKKYPSYSEKDKIPFSQYLYYHLETYVIRPYFAIAKILSDYDVSKYAAKNMARLKKYIEIYEKFYGCEPDFNREKVMFWFEDQTGLTSAQVKQYLEIFNRKKVDIDDNSSDSDKKTAHDIEDSRFLRPDQIEELKDEWRERILVAQKFWKEKQYNSPVNKALTASLFTWNLLKDLNIPEEYNIKKFLYEFEIIDKKILEKFFNKKYAESFSQKDIARELGITPSNANKLLNERFLDLLKEQLNQEQNRL